MTKKLLPDKGGRGGTEGSQFRVSREKAVHPEKGKEGGGKRTKVLFSWDQRLTGEMVELKKKTASSANKGGGT